VDPSTPISELPLSTRAKNALSELGVKLVEDMEVVSMDELLTVPRCGTATVAEIVDIFPEVQQKSRELQRLAWLVAKYPEETYKMLGLE
jgi:DNA-directed RNA polymerase alpha subunit